MPVCWLSVSSVSLPSASARSFGAIALFGPVPTQESAAWPWPLSWNPLVAEAAAQHAAGRRAAEQSAQSTLEEVAQVAARGGAGRRGRRPVAEQTAENVREAAAAIAGCRTASGRYAGGLAAGAGGVAATPLERLVRKQSKERDDDRRHAAATAAAGLRLAAGAILHAGENVAQSHVCLRFLSEPDMCPPPHREGRAVKR